jgi:hypothetical protein
MALINVTSVDLTKVAQFAADPENCTVDLHTKPARGWDMYLRLGWPHDPGVTVATIDALIVALQEVRARALRDMATQPEPAATETEAELAAEREPAL